MNLLEIENKLYKNLRCYQKDGINQILQYIQCGKKSILRQNFTGTGKSVEQMYLAVNHLYQHSENIVLFLTHKEELVKNLAEYFLAEKINVSYIQSGRHTILTNRIYIASVDTLKNRLDKLNIKPTLILIEECHHGLAKTWLKILNHYQNAVKIGFSATPERLDGKSFNKVFECLVTGNKYKWYIDNNYLAPYKFISPSVFINMDNVKKIKGEFDLNQQYELLDGDVIYADIIETWKKFTPGLKTVTFCTSVEHSKKVAQAYNEFSLYEYGKEIAIHLDGTTDKIFRRQAMDRFKLSSDHPDSILIICNFNLINEGVNIPSCSVTQWLRKTASEIFYDQGNGRSNRYEPNKIQYIIDHVGNKLIHGYPDRNRHFDLKGKKERDLEAKYNLVCPICETVVSNDYRRLQNACEFITCSGCDCDVPVPQKKKQREPRKDKEHDDTVEMLLEDTSNADMVNMYALFRKFDKLPYKKFFDKIITLEYITLDDFKLACEYRNLPETYAYSAYSRKLALSNSINTL